VGGSQAGPTMGYYLRQQGYRFAIFERGDSIAPAWRERWDSLTLFTPRRYSSLPGLPFPGDPEGYPTRDEVITYIERCEAASTDSPKRKTEGVLSAALCAMFGRAAIFA
jgi:putative flavoprotein involved in K+ transport